MSRTISANYSSGLALINTADSPVYIAQGVVIANAGGKALVDDVGYFWAITAGANAQVDGDTFGLSLAGAGTVTNKGLISASYTAGAGFTYASGVLGILSAAIYLGGGGISNAQSGVIQGGVIGLAMGGAGSVVNAGRITDVYPGFGFGAVLTSGGSLTNMSGGSIYGGTYGVITDGKASVTNLSGGTITGGAANTRSVGVLMINGAGSATNQGSIKGVVYGIELVTGGAVSNLAGGSITGGSRGVFAVNGAGTVTNQGTINANGAGIELLQGGAVSNLSGGTIDGAAYGIFVYHQVGSVLNQAAIDGTATAGILLDEGGSVTNTGTGAIYGGNRAIVAVKAAATVTNSGLIKAMNGASSSTVVSGILSYDGGSVTNTGGTIISPQYGVDLTGASGTVTNAGLIASSASYGGAGVVLLDGGSIGNSKTIASFGDSVIILNAPGTVNNTGLIVSHESGHQNGAGVALWTGGSVTNAASSVIDGEWIGVEFGQFGASGTAAAATLDNLGMISASDDLGDGAAVWIHGPGVVINKPGGTIQGVTNGTIASGPLAGFVNGGFGIVAYYQTTVVNYGSIGGGEFAFDAAGTAAGIGNLIEMAPGASFGGIVLGAHNAANAAFSTLGLLSGASTGTVSGFGSTYKYFGNVTISGSANWVLGGSVASGTTIAFAATGVSSLTFASPGSVQGLITNFASGDAIGLDGITVTGSSYAGGVLTVDDTAGSIALDFAVGFPGNDLVVRNAGTEATVTFATTQDRTLSWTGASGAAFSTAANWADLTNGFGTAQVAPNATDTILFNGSGGAVTGTGTAAAIFVGDGGEGALEISRGATITAASFAAGVGATDIGQIGLTGTGTDLTITGAATVAGAGTGVLSVLSGATFAAASLTIGALGSGAVFVSGTGSLLDIAGALNIGTALGTGELTVGPGASIEAGVIDLQGAVALEGGLLDPSVQLIAQDQTAGGWGTIAADDIIDEGTIAAGAGKLLVVEGTVLGGSLTVDGTAQPAAPGVLWIGNGGTLELTGPVLNGSPASFTGDISPIPTYTVSDSVVDVNFASGGGELLLDDIGGFAATIAAWRAGDAFVITGGTLTDLGVSNGDTLTVADSGSGGTDRIVFGSAIDAAAFGITGGDTIVAGATGTLDTSLSCFAAGTRIATEDGWIAVEHLATGDRALTHRGAPAEIVWIGSRAVDCRHHPDPGAVCPVRIRADAFGPGAPARDLLLSPDHAIFVADVLIPVHCLINGGTIRQMVVPEVTYYHLELPEHDVILAEGLPVESYLDTGGRANFGGGGVVRLFPDFSAFSASWAGPARPSAAAFADRDGRAGTHSGARMWEMAGCAPLVLAGPVVERVKRSLPSPPLAPTDRSSPRSRSDG